MSKTTRRLLIVLTCVAGVLSLSTVTQAQSLSPTISWIYPPSGWYDASLKICGTNFVPGASVTVAGIDAGDVSVTGSTMITCKPPGDCCWGTTGPVDVVVTNPDGQSTTHDFTCAPSGKRIDFAGGSCESGPPCTFPVSVAVWGGSDASDGTVILRSFSQSGAKLGEWAARVSRDAIRNDLGIASFGEVTTAPAGTPPQTCFLTADYVPDSADMAPASEWRALAITPVLEAQIPIPELDTYLSLPNSRPRGWGLPVAIDEATNRVYVATLNDSVKVFDGTTNEMLAPITLRTATITAILTDSVAIDSARRRLYVVDCRGDCSNAELPDMLWIYDLDKNVVVEAVPLVKDDQPLKAWQIAVNPTTGIVYLDDWHDGRLLAFDPSASADRIRVGPYVLQQSLGGAPMTWGAQITVNPITNLIYTGGSIVDGLNLTTLPFTWPCCGNWADDYHNWSAEAGIDARRGRAYSISVGNGNLPLTQQLEIRDSTDKSAPTFNGVQLQVPLVPEWGASCNSGPCAYCLVADRLQVFGAAQRVYVNFEFFDRTYWYGWPGDPHTGYPGSEGTPLPVSVFDSRTGARIADWWLPIQNNPFDGSWMKVNPVNGRLYLWPGDGMIHVYRDPVVDEQTTNVGSSVTTSVPEAAITFATVASPGVTTVQSISPTSANASLPGQFEMTGAVAYEVSTTATVSPPIQVCFNSSITDEAAFNALTVLHGENGVWTDRTVSRDFATGTICASVSSLSPFAVARKKPYDIRPVFDTTRAFKSGSTAPIKIQVFDATGTNISSSMLAVRAVDLVLRPTNASFVAVDSGTANPDADFRYDSSLGGYIFNLSTKALRGTYDLRFRIGADGRTYSVSIQVK